jgi:endothelin-converting enzyme/putative endopeptidase
MALSIALLQAQSGTLRGIEASDIDRSVDPCVDFYQFANGKWRAENDSASDATLEPALGRRRVGKGWPARILNDVSGGPSLPKGSVEQLIGDFYGACMNESRVNELGVKPIKPLLDDIEQIRDVAAVQRMIGRLHTIGIAVPFSLSAVSDNHKPGDVVAEISAGGLGLPDRDYYLKPDARFQDARDKYLAHVAAMFRLAGESDAAANAGANAVVRLERRIAEASLDNVALRDPAATDHKMSFGELQRLAPAFNWSAYYKEAGLAPAPIAEPKFVQAFNRD